MKNLTKLAYACAITCSAGTVGAWTTTEGDNWSYQVPLGGNINDDRPPWEFEIPQGAVDLATDMDVLHLSGVVVDDNTEWTFPNWSGQVLFQGQIKNILSKGVPGMTPTIEIGGVTLVEAMPDIVVPVTGDASEVGQMVIKAEVGASAVSRVTYSDDLYSNDTISPTASQIAKAMVTNHTDYLGAYNPDDVIPQDAAMDTMTGLLAQGGHRQQLQSRVVLVEELSLSFPSATIPSTWTATLPIEVTIQ